VLQFPFPARQLLSCLPLKAARRKSSRSHSLSNAHSYFISSHLQNPKVANLTSQFLASSSAHGRSDPDTDALDDDELFAELEAEIEDDDGPLREQGLKELQREYEGLFFCQFVE
jgi:hypothetical protein